MGVSNLKADYTQEVFNTDHLQSDLRGRAVRGAGAAIFARVSIYGINMISVVILARLLAPEDFGLVTMVTAPCMLLMDFGNMGLTDATIQSQEINHKQISTLFWINTMLSLSFSVLLISLAPVFVWFYDEPRLKSITIAFSVALIFSGLSGQHLGLLKRNMRFFAITVNEIIAAITSVVIAVILALHGYRYWALVGRQVSLSLAITVGSWILCRWRPSLPGFGTGIGTMLRFGTNLLANNTIYYFSKNLDKVLLGRRYGTQPLAYYDRAYHLFVMPVNQLGFPLTSVAVATLSRLRDDLERYRRYFLNALSILALLGMLVSAIITLTAEDLVFLLLGRQWGETGQILGVFGPAIGVMLLYVTTGWLHLSMGRSDRLLRFGIISVIVTVLLIVMGLPFGPWGVAIAYGVSFYVLVIPSLWYAARPVNLKIPAMLSVIWKPFVSALSAGLLSWFVLYSAEVTSNIFASFNVFVRIIVCAIVCICIYVLLIIILYRGTKSLLQFLAVFRDMTPSMSIRKVG
jgi:PST family polysaccharide transporter